MIAAIGGWLARSALMSSPVGGFLKLVPAWAWKALAIAALILTAVLVHQSYAHKAIKAADAAGYARAIADVKTAQDKARAAAIEHKQKVEAKDVAAATKARNGYAKDVDDLGAAYDELRRKPAPQVQRFGRSQGSVPGAPDHPGGAAAAAEGADAGLSPRPLGSELAIVNWPELLEHGQSCDVDRARLTALQDLVRAFAANHETGKDNGK